MSVMRTAGNGHMLPAHANVREGTGEYLIELDVADFTESELSIAALGRRLTIRGDQLESGEDDGKAFRLHERLEESFLLPDDADLDEVKIFFEHGTLEIHAPRIRLEPRQLRIEHPSHRLNPDATPC